jgi:hypothetical protein
MFNVLENLIIKVQWCEYTIELVFEKLFRYALIVGVFFTAYLLFELETILKGRSSDIIFEL